MGSWAAPVEGALRQGAKRATWITSACAWTRSKKPPSARILQGTAWRPAASRRATGRMARGPRSMSPTRKATRRTQGAACRLARHPAKVAVSLLEAPLDRRRLLKLTSLAMVGAASLPATASPRTSTVSRGLWSVWDQAFARARYVSLSHVLTPDAPLWNGFPPATDSSRAPEGSTKSRLTPHSPTRRPAWRLPRIRSRPTSSARSSTRPRTGTNAFQPSTNCRRRSLCASSR